MENIEILNPDKVEEIKKGKILSIKDKRFQVVEDWDKGFDKLPSGKEKWYSIFELVEIGKEKMTPSYSLIIYNDEKDICLIDKLNNSKKKLKKEEVKVTSS
jgi:hypothetical protein